MKAKRPALIAALDGRFDDHHEELARMLLDQIDARSTQINTLSTRIDELPAAMPDAQPVEPRPENPGSGTSTDTERKVRSHIAQLTALGYHATR
jgi:transposase